MDNNIYYSHAEWEKIGLSDDEHGTRRSAAIAIANTLFWDYAESDT